MFGWHKEDMDLYSINYLHTGQTKLWYGIDLDQNEKFERLVKTHFPDYFKDCPEFIRHKTTLISPEILQQANINFVRAVHNEGEFIVSRAAAYHSGFNFGFNVAEAVNFALPRWIDIAANVKCCKCTKDAVMINMGVFK
jgi:jumonji domain-containing protein 2